MKFRILLAFISLIALSACGSRATSSPDAQPTDNPSVAHQPAVAVQTESLRRESLQGTVVADGQVVADAGGQAVLAFPTDGQIASISVKIGDRVERGQVLASLDARLANSAIEQARADVSTARASLAKAAAGARPQEIAGNGALVQGARAAADAARAELERQQALAKAGISSERDLQQARSNYENALAEQQSKQQEGSLLKAGPRPQDVELARTQVQQAQAALAAAQTKASLLQIVAPFTGVVTQRLKNPGETVDPTIPVLAIVNPNKTVVEVQISQDQARLIQTGNAATLTTTGLNRTLSGRVEAVSAAFGQETRTMTVRITPYGGGLAPGASAKATIVVRSLSNAFVVPDSAIVKNPETGNPVVYVARGQGDYKPVPVRIVLETGSRAAIAAAGLRAGASIVTKGAYELLPFSGGTSD